jgi:hypothetical protein
MKGTLVFDGCKRYWLENTFTDPRLLNSKISKNATIQVFMEDITEDELVEWRPDDWTYLQELAFKSWVPE